MLRELSYRSDLLNDLKNDIGYAAKYLSAALADSQEAFLVALRDVAEANKMARVAEEAHLSRESLYRTLSKEGNPRFSTLDSILNALGMTLSVQLKNPGPSHSAPSVKSRIASTSFEPLDAGITITSTPTALRNITTSVDALIFTNSAAAPSTQTTWASNTRVFVPGFIAHVTGTAEEPRVYSIAD